MNLICIWKTRFIPGLIAILPAASLLLVPSVVVAAAKGSATFVITRMAARIYGRRQRKRRAEKIKQCVEQVMKEDEGPPLCGATKRN